MTDAIERMRASKLAYEVQQIKDGEAAGISFAIRRGKREDLLIFHKVWNTDCGDDDDDDVLELLFIEYSNRRDYSEEEFKEHLFGDEYAEPSEDFICGFFCAATEKLEAIATA